MGIAIGSINRICISASIRKGLPIALKNKFLFLWTGNYSNGNLKNSLGSDVITITDKDFTTSIIPSTTEATFAVPDNATYLGADGTDDFWYDGSDVLQQKTFADLIASTTLRSFIKYSDSEPYYVYAIGILKAGEVLTEADKIALNKYFKLWAEYWGVLMDSGYMKDNRVGSEDGPDGAPSALIATVVNDTTIQLDWTNGSTNHDGHRIYISTDGVTFTANSTVLGATATKEVTGLAYTDPSFQFYVKAYKATNESTASNTVQVDRENIGAYPMPASEALAAATIYLDSAATGAANGTSWENAFTTFAAAHTAASDGSVIEISGGASGGAGKTYVFTTTVTKGVTIQGSKTTGHSGLVTLNGQFYVNNPAHGTVKLVNVTHIGSAASPYWYSEGSNIEAYDVTFGPYIAAAVPRVYGVSVKYTKCIFKRNYISGSVTSNLFLPLTGAATIEYNYCVFDYACGQSGSLIAGSKLTLNHCTLLNPVEGIFNIGNSALTDVIISNCAFFGVYALLSGANSKAPIVTNTYWMRQAAGDNGLANFDSSNKSVLTNCLKDVLPYFTTPKNNTFGELVLRFDDANNLDKSVEMATILNPEVKITHAVDLHGTRSIHSSHVDAMRTLVANGNEISGHGSSHSFNTDLEGLKIVATGTTPLLNIVVTQDGDSSTWTGTLSITINSVTENYDLTNPLYNTLLKLHTALNGHPIGNGIITTTRITVAPKGDHVLSTCFAGIVNQSISSIYTMLLDDTAFIRFEIEENILDIESYINSGTDRNGDNAVAGTTVDPPSTPYVVQTFAMAYGQTRTSVGDYLQNRAAILGANSAQRPLSLFSMYNYRQPVNIYASTYKQMTNLLGDCLFAMACACVTGKTFYPLYHGSDVIFNGSVANAKAMLLHFGLGSRTFSEWLTYLRTDAGWTLTEPNIAFTGDEDDYLDQGDYTLLSTSPLKGRGSLVAI